MRRKAAAGAAACLIGVTGCSHTVTGQSASAHHRSSTSPTTSAAIPQAELVKGFVADQDPMGVFTEGFYYLLRQPMPTGVAITGYRHQIAADAKTSKVSAWAFMPPGTWQPITDTEIVWSPTRGDWVETDRTETLSPGPTGSRGWPTVKSVADFGTSYYTFSYEELGGHALEDGLEAGFDEGVGLPRSAQDGKFSAGAKAYLMTQTSVDPFYTIHRIKNANTNVDQLFPVYSCGKPASDCTTPATSLEAATQGGHLINLSGTARLDLDSDGHATLRPVGSDIAFATYTYRIIDAGGPKRLTLQADNRADAKKFDDAMSAAFDEFALFEFAGQVTIGLADPPNNTTTAFAGYNRTAVNDLLNQWTPKLPPVLPS